MCWCNLGCGQVKLDDNRGVRQRLVLLLALFLLVWTLSERSSNVWHWSLQQLLCGGVSCMPVTYETCLKWDLPNETWSNYLQRNRVTSGRADNESLMANTYCWYDLSRFTIYVFQDFVILMRLLKKDDDLGSCGVLSLCDNLIKGTNYQGRQEAASGQV